MPPAQESAVFGAGCFWIMDYYFEKIDGVKECKCIYTNSGSEAVMLVYDRNKISFSELCNVFFELHDPTTDYKAQYKSIIQVDLQSQKEIAHKIIKKQKKAKTIVQSIGTYTYPEKMHEDWHKKKNSLPKCNIPKNAVLDSLLE